MPTPTKFNSGFAYPVGNAVLGVPQKRVGVETDPYENTLRFHIPRRAGVIPLLGEMSAKQTKGSAESLINRLERLARCRALSLFCTKAWVIFLLFCGLKIKPGIIIIKI